jgi:hypothetical protein
VIGWIIFVTCAARDQSAIFDQEHGTDLSILRFLEPYIDGFVVNLPRFQVTFGATREDQPFLLVYVHGPYLSTMGHESLYAVLGGEIPNFHESVL